MHPTDPKPVPVLSLKERQRFEGQFKRRGIDDCWEWLKSLASHGYGSFKISRNGKKTSLRAHRVAYFLHYGVDPGQLCIMHSCDNRACVNPYHMSLGTSPQNTADRHAKGRDADQKGEKNGSSKLTDKDVREIRQRQNEGETTQSLAMRFNVTSGNINYILRGESWKHIV